MGPVGSVRTFSHGAADAGGAHPGRNRLFGIFGTPLGAWIGAGTHTCLLNSLASVLGMKRN